METVYVTSGLEEPAQNFPCILLPASVIADPNMEMKLLSAWSLGNQNCQSLPANPH